MRDLVVHQSLGRSFATRRQVNEIIKAAAPVTTSVVFDGVVIWLAIALPIGGLPGLGKTAVAALDGFDLPTVQGIVVFSTVAIIALNLIVDLLYAWIDPRIGLLRGCNKMAGSA